MKNKKILWALLVSLLLTGQIESSFALTTVAECPVAADRVASTIPTDDQLRAIPPVEDENIGRDPSVPAGSGLNELLATTCAPGQTFLAGSMAISCIKWCNTNFPKDIQRCLKFCNFGKNHSCEEIKAECERWKLRDKGLYLACARQYNLVCPGTKLPTKLDTPVVAY